MLNMANIVLGSRVLDVAAGTGEQTILAVRRVGPPGSVLATDIAAQMLKIAAETAHQVGLSNVTTQVMDAQQLDGESESFDAAISRLSLMFIPDLPGALASIRRALKPGGKRAAIVMSSAEKSHYVAVPLEIACRHTRRPVSASPETREELRNARSSVDVVSHDHRVLGLGGQRLSRRIDESARP